MNPRRSTALVTGGSRGIGGAIARRLAADGTDILIGCAGDVRTARPVAGTIQAPGRPGTAADTAAMVAFPAGDAAFITGQQFTVEGGAAI